MRGYSNIFKVIGALLIGVFVASCGDSSGHSHIDTMKKNNKITIGVKDDVPKFALYNPKSGEIEGFEVDIAKLLTKDLLGDSGEMVLKPVNAKTRTTMLDTGAIDSVIATFTITEERKKNFNFSTPYYDDYVGLLVLKENNFTSLKSLNEKIIGVAQGATSQKVIQSAANQLNIKLKFESYPDYATLKSALTAKRIDAFSVDKSILLGYVDDKSEILRDNFSKQSYGIVTTKKDQAWSDFVDNFVKTHEIEINALKVKWGLAQ